MKKSLVLFFALLCWASASFAATDTAADADMDMAAGAEPAAVNDPLEPFNRAMFDFNFGLDRYLIRPVALGYRTVTPQAVRTHIAHASDNLYEPVNAVNALLQGNVTQGVQSLWRFVINTTLGIGGLNDIATEAGLPDRREDFGQTLAVWGVDAGPYLVLPIFGPANVRDAGGRIGDWFLDPINYAMDSTTAIEIDIAQGIVRREQLIEAIDEINNASLDPYVTYRSIYEQRRKAQIEDRYNITHTDIQQAKSAAPETVIAEKPTAEKAETITTIQNVSFETQTQEPITPAFPDLFPQPKDASD